MSLSNKKILITGGAVRLGREMALAIARAGGDLIIHYNSSRQPAEELRNEIIAIGSNASLIQADLADPDSIFSLLAHLRENVPIYGLVNSASIFEPLDITSTTRESWDLHFDINLRAPFLLSQSFVDLIEPGQGGRIVNILDWRALRPGEDHFPYTISKAALAALTKSLAVALAPKITVNGLAFGAILPPSDGASTNNILDFVPAERWADLDEVGKTLLFLLDGPTYITGEIIHLDGGRHLI
ncbi:MAG: SDR family oxidoreductase [Chloroflexota bacterium]|nr:MAG: SDR family oxidoreductase [Chloroflexota bacterium]